MADSYKLVFRGEVLEGQHPAVVRKRLGEAGGFDAAQLDKLFSGRPVVVKRAADTAVAARIQSMFRKAGARLRVLPVDEEGSAAAPQSPAETAAGTEDTPAGSTGFQLLPPGSDLLRASERRQPVTRDVDTSALSLQGATFTVAEPAPAPRGPDVSHLSVAEAGTDLGVGSAAPAEPVTVPGFELAEPGADLGQRAAPAVPDFDWSELDFEVAPAGSELRESRAEPQPAPPDTSHLSLTPQ
ncbi:MAG: hypothetical protein U5Q16_05715 [Gammaproteobacteria bacterium]|nr:hypothetical protein [Gammaproteobacteria bacterium]